MMSQKVCCRTCLCEYGDLVPIFSDECYVDDLPDKLLNTISIEVQKDDELPKMICKKCIFLVDSLHCFKDQCEMAELKLKESLKNSLPSFSTVGELISSCEINALNSELSSDEYPIVYASEEAKREYENSVKWKKYQDKKKKRKSSGPKVKSVIQILPSDGKEKPTYKDTKATSTSKHKNSIKEETIVSDIDDKSSSFISDEEESSRYSSNTYDKYYSDSIISGTKYYNEKSLSKEPTKRKHVDNYFISHSPKVPKTVMFKDDNFNEDQDFNYKEIVQNEIVPSAESLQVLMEDNVIYNLINEVTKSNKTNNVSKTFGNSLPSIPPNKDFQTTYDSPMTLLKNYATVYLPSICTICSSSFDSHKEVLKHKLECHLKLDQTSYFCPICHENFPCNGNLVDHVNIHKEVMSLVCLLCSGCFYTEETLRKHLQESHVNINELKCNTCSEKFHHPRALQTHIKEHVTSVHFSCMICSKECKNKDELSNHLDKEHSKHLLNKNSKCETCGMRLSKKDLINHIKIHPSHVCSFCQQSYPEKKNLWEHIYMYHKINQDEVQQVENLDQQQQLLNCFTQLETIECGENNGSKFEEIESQNKFPNSTEGELSLLTMIIPKDRKKFRCRVCHEIVVSRSTYVEHLKDKHMSVKQTNEILKELSESVNSDKRGEQNKSYDSLST